MAKSSTEYSREWRRNNPEKDKKNNRRNTWRRRGIDPRAAEILLKHSDVCDVCKSSDSLYVDHCHVSSKLRGVLCFKCNTALGLFGDNITTLKQAINYLEKFNAAESNTNTRQ